MLQEGCCELNIIMVDLAEYSSQRLVKSNQPELKAILQKYKEEQLPLWKFGLFVGYHALALVGMYKYGARLAGKRVPPSIHNRHKLTVFNMMIGGVKHASIMVSLYAMGLYAVCYGRISLPLVRKLSEIQTTYDSFGLRFDPNYQEYLLFARMRKFDLSEDLIQEIRQELNCQKKRLIEVGGLLPKTIERIGEMQELYLTREKEVR